MNAEQRARELAEEKISDRDDLFIVDVKMHPGGKLEILVDGDRGLSVQDCVAISRHVGFHLEEEDAVGHAYNLEVSSPGIDTPLKLERQYRKNEGRTLSVKSADGSLHEGKLQRTEESGIIIEEELKGQKGKKVQQAELFIPFDQVVEAKVLISFK
jgi:ribosome maturation factor RimP